MSWLYNFSIFIWIRVLYSEYYTGNYWSWLLNFLILKLWNNIREVSPSVYLILLTIHSYNSWHSHNRLIELSTVPWKAFLNRKFSSSQLSSACGSSKACPTICMLFLITYTMYFLVSKLTFYMNYNIHSCFYFTKRLFRSAYFML